jgi:hypothetical protein
MVEEGSPLHFKNRTPEMDEAMNIFDELYGLFPLSAKFCVRLDVVTLDARLYDKLRLFVDTLDTRPDDERDRWMSRATEFSRENVLHFGYLDGNYSCVKIKTSYINNGKTGVYDGEVYVNGAHVLRGTDLGLKQELVISSGWKEQVVQTG